MSLHVVADPPVFEPLYRIGIKQQGLVLQRRESAFEWHWALWGLVPNRPARYPLNNTRADKLGQWPWKYVQSNRCLVPATGFFEPEKPAGAEGRVPWRYYSSRDQQPLCMPGLWAEFTDTETGEIGLSYTVIIVDANEAIVKHTRMPALLSPDDGRRWMTASELPLEVLRPCPADWLTDWRVADRAKNSRSPNTPDLLIPVDDAQTDGQ